MVDHQEDRISRTRKHSIFENEPSRAISVSHVGVFVLGDVSWRCCHKVPTYQIALQRHGFVAGSFYECLILIRNFLSLVSLDEERVQTHIAAEML